jgi:uncharacterized protein (TIGR02266 family)
MTSIEHPPRPGRVDVALAVDMQVSDRVFGGVAKNIGIGGMFVAADHLRTVGDEFVLTFRLPGQKEPVSVRGEVRWVRASFVTTSAEVSGMGIRFLDLKVGSAVAIADFIRATESVTRRRPVGDPGGGSTDA